MDRVRAGAAVFTERALQLLLDRQDWKLFAGRLREIAEWVLRRIFRRLLKQAEKIHYV